MNGADPGSFLTSAVTAGAGTVAKGAVGGGLGGALEGAWLGASVGMMGGPIGVLGGTAIGAGLGAAFGTLTGTSKAMVKVWDQLIGTTKSLIGTFAKFSPLLSAQQERWKMLDMQLGKVWAKTLEPTLKRITDFGLEFRKEWTRIKVGVFKNWEDSLNNLLTIFEDLGKISLVMLEFFTKLNSLIKDLLGFALTPLIEAFKGLVKLIKWILGIEKKEPLVSPGIPKWAPGAVPGYGMEAGAGGKGGIPLLRGEFEPGAPMPEWAKEGKMRFEWVKWLAERRKEAKEEAARPLPPGWFDSSKPYPPEYPKPIHPEEAEAYERARKARGKGPTSMLPIIPIPGGPVIPAGAMMTAALGAVPEIRLSLEERKRQREEKREFAERMKTARKAVKEAPRGEERKEAFQELEALREEGREMFDPEEAAKRKAAELEALAKGELPEEETPVRGERETPKGGVIMQVLDSNQLLDMLSFSWDEIRKVLRQQQAEYMLLKYRMQSEGTYL